MKRILLICGIVIFLGGIGLGLYLKFAFLGASALTSAPTCRPTDHCGILYDLTLNTSSSIVSESDTVVVTADILADAPVSLRLTAPGFDPSATEPKHLILSEVIIHHNRGYDTIVRRVKPNRLNWVLTPTKIGTFQVVAEMDDISGNVMLTKYLEITITNTFGLNPWLVQLFSYITTFLGPILTAPWWYDRWKERKQKMAVKPKLAIHSLQGKRSKRGHRSKGR